MQIVIIDLDATSRLVSDIKIQCSFVQDILKTPETRFIGPLSNMYWVKNDFLWNKFITEQSKIYKELFTFLKSSEINLDFVNCQNITKTALCMNILQAFYASYELFRDVPSPLQNRVLYNTLEVFQKMQIFFLQVDFVFPFEYIWARNFYISAVSSGFANIVCINICIAGTTIASHLKQTLESVGEQFTMVVYFNMFMPTTKLFQQKEVIKVLGQLSSVKVKEGVIKNYTILVRRHQRISDFSANDQVPLEKNSIS